MSGEVGMFMTMPWREVEVAADDRTMTVRFNATFEEGHLIPCLSAEPGVDEVRLRLELVPDTSLVAGSYFSYTGAEPNHAAEIVLPEPVGGRRIVDAWEPPPAPQAPPPPRRVIELGEEVGPVAAGRRLHLESLGIYDHVMVVEYRLRPGEREEDESIHALWQLEVEDDLDTEYEVPGGGYGGDAEEIMGDLDVTPPPPPQARSLTLVVYEFSSDGAIERGRVAVALR